MLILRTFLGCALGLFGIAVSGFGFFFYFFGGICGTPPNALPMALVGSGAVFFGGLLVFNGLKASGSPNASETKTQ